jgi:hypothetical protein
VRFYRQSSMFLSSVGFKAMFDFDILTLIDL